MAVCLKNYKMDENQNNQTTLSAIKSINLTELFPKILNVEEGNFMITPSEYIKEMSLSMEERHKKLVSVSSAPKLVHKSCPPQFKIIPHVVVFQRFEARSTNRLTLEIKNVGKTMLPVKMYCPNSVYFSATYQGAPANKLAPGLSVVYEITFTPRDARDYSHHLVILSKELTFQVPITAIGPRPLLDIPDHIILNPSPVKISTTKFIVVRNIGTAPAVFNFITHSKHFQVTPSKGILPVHDSMVLNISFESAKVQEVTESALLAFETGEKLLVTMRGSAENISVRLEKSSLVHEDTFVGLRRCKTVRLINSSSSVLKFCWKKNRSEEEDRQLIERLKAQYKELSEVEVLRDTKVTASGLSSANKHKISCERILCDELRVLEKEEFAFCHEAFKIMPQSGEVWPKTSVEMIVAFEPKGCGLSSGEAYLEVSGRDGRLPLRIKGTGLGPHIAMNLKVLDIDYIYLCSLHRYEVIAENKGDIPGTIEYLAEPLVFGGKVEVLPGARHLGPGEVGSFVISFTSNRQGDFTEKLQFAIRESQEKVPLLLKGKIINPTLHFDIKSIDFGIIPVGFPRVQEVTLSNLSVVPVTFTLRILSDGDVPSISWEQFAKFTVKPALSQRPKEFQIEPEESVVEPFSSKKVTITLTPNKAGYFQTHLVVDMWDSENGAITCPISYHSVIPTLVADPDVITIPFCFINFPYTRSITLKNLAKVPAFYYIIPSDPSKETSITCSASIPQGVVEPRDSVKFDITVITSALGRQFYPVYLLTFGNESAREVCRISCVGQGPVVTVTPVSLQWGQVSLLDRVDKMLQVANESPIPATVTLSVVKQSTPWTVEPSSVTIATEKSVTITVSLLLNDRGKFSDTLKVNVYNGKVLTVPLSAIGIGSSLQIRPNMSPTYNLGTLFSHKKYEFEITVENKGNKPYGLVWSPYPEYRSFANAKFIIPPEYPFKIGPVKMEILPGEVKSAILEVKGPSTGHFQQTFYCFAGVGVPAKELHLTSEISAEFVGPLITFDKTEIHYWYNIGYENTAQKLDDTVNVSNLSVLPLSIELVTSHPFCLVKESQECARDMTVNMDGLEVKQLHVRFVAEQNENKVSRSYRGLLSAVFKDQAKMCSVELKGEVNYPNLLALPRSIDFGYVPVGTRCCTEVCLVNISPMAVHYEIRWNANKSEVVYPSRPTMAAESEGFDLEDSGTCESGSGPAEDLMEEEGEPVTDKNSAEATQNVVPPVKPFPRMPPLEISKSDITAALFPLMRNHYSSDNELVTAYRTVRSTDAEVSSASSIARLFDITPFYGKLEAYCSQILQVKFHSNAPVNAHVRAVLNVRSGPTEVVTMSAISAEIDFQLSAVELDFGKQLFCETKSKSLRIQNTAAMPFTFEADAGNNQVCELNENFPLGRGVLTVSPKLGTVKSFEDAELIVRYHPGVPGKFLTDFQLQIAYLEPIRVKVKGCGVFPQVYASLPRPDILHIDAEIGYLAVASITPDWILTGFASGTGMYDLNCTKPYRSRESNLDNFAGEDPGEDRWEIIQYSSSVPSEIDVMLAVERILAYNLVKKDSGNNATFAIYARTIPSFNVPAYDLDFGVCVIGRTVEQNVTVTNFGPLPVVIYGIFESHLKEEGIHIRLKNRNELRIGACLPFIVAFHPRKSKYKEKYEKLHSLFYFEIYHGPRIPINIFASVTYPYVISSMRVLSFGEVICGCCKVINLKLNNPGLVTAQWSMHTKRSGDVGPKPHPNALEGRTMFHLNYNSGVLNPGEYCSMQVSFKPEFQGSFYAVMYVRVAESLEELKILLLGNGIEPRLNISQRLLKFKSTLPYPNKVEKIFSVENPCPFPIEFYLPAFDEQIYEEERVLRAVTLYYQTKEILLPVRRPGEGLPSELVDFYHSLVDGLNQNFMEAEREKILAERERESLEENGSSLVSAEDAECLLVGSQNAFAEKKKRRQRKLSRSRTSVDTSRPFTASNDNGREPVVQSIFEKKTSLEIDEMLQDYISTLWEREPAFDPVHAALTAVLPTAPEQEYTDGTLIIFHGAPYTNSAQLANRAAVFVSMPALSIDRIVLEEAAFARCAAGLAAKELIEQAYLDYVGAEARKSSFGDECQETEETALEEDFDFDAEYEEIQRKFNALVTLRENLLSGKGRSGPVGSAKSEGSRKAEKGGTPTAKPQMNANAPVANISEDLVAEMLKFRLGLEVGEGVVMEGLESVLIGPPPKALISVLKAAGNIKDIIVIFLLSNYSQYSRYQLILQAEQDLAKLNFREGILQILEEEPEEIFQNLNLNPEDEQTIRQIFLAHRHDSNAVYQKKMDAFYEIQRLKKAAAKQGLPVPSLSPNVQFDSAPATEKRDKDNSKKKEAAKGTKTSEVSNRMTGSDAKSGRLKRDALEGEFLSFEMDFIEMRAVIESWDQRLGAVVVGSGMETKTKKGHTTPRKVESAASAKSKSSRGLFLWLVDVSNPEHNSFGSCCYALRASLRNRLRPAESAQWPLDAPEAITFSVATCPPLRERTTLNSAFAISATDNVLDLRLVGEDPYEDLGEYVPPPQPTNSKLNRSLSSISFKSKRKGSALSKRRRTDSRMGSVMRSLRSRRSLSSCGMDENQLKSRYVLQPGEMQSYRVRYFPTETGRWEQIYEMNFVNWSKSDSVHCLGVCDIPHVDMKPEIMFPAVEHSKPLTTIFTPAYYYLEDAYDFGSIITLQSNDGKKIAKSAILTLANHSTLAVDLCVLRGEDGTADEPTGSENIRFEPDKFWLTPGESKKLTITASPAKNGPLVESLLLVVKDNPRVERIRVKFEGVRANVTVDPKVVNFDRLLLHRKEYRRAVLTNHNMTPLFVSLKGVEQLPPQFSFCQKSGWIPPMGSLTMEIHYSATEVQLINNHPITVQVFDDIEAEEPAQELTFNITVEAYDAALDIIFANAEDDHIDFGDIRVENNYSIPFNLRNSGKYPLGYKIDMDCSYFGDMEDSSVFVAPQDGKLFPGKLCPVVANFLARDEVCWRRMPLFKIMLVEPYFGDELIATIPVAVSARSHFSRYEIKPEKEFNFGHLKVGSVTKRSILIHNKGHFPLSYSIEFQSLGSSSEESGEAMKRPSKQSASSKEKVDKMKKAHGAFRAGAFEVAPQSGTAEPGQTAVVSLVCCPAEVRRFEERIVVFVSESLPHLKKGNPITISAEGCLPSIKFDDLRSIFREHFVCKTEAELNSRIKPGSYTVYTASNNLFSFKNVCVNKTAEARVHLQNAGLIECSVTASLRVQGDEEGARTSSGDANAFSLSPEKLIIEPYSCGCLVLSFRPEALEVYRGRVAIVLEMPEPNKDVVQEFGLWGNGVLPQIEITEPKTKLAEGQTLVNFPPTSVGYSSTSSIAFSNTGVLDCRVIIELYKFQNGIFKITPKPSTEKMLKIWELSRPIDHTAVVSLAVGEVAEFVVTFSPPEVQSYSSQIKLFIVDNPFENWSFKLVGEVFFEEVVIEKVRTGLPFLAERPDEESSSTPLSPGQYFISFRECYVKKKSKLLLRLSNKTDKDYFKFEWDEIRSISVSPLTGHLYPNSYKEILFVFYPEEPMELEDVTIACMLYKIVLEHPPEPSWDSRLVICQKHSKPESNISPRSYEKKESSGCAGCDAVVEVTGEEPEYEVVPESNRMLYVNVSGVADYARLICEAPKIIFKNTFMFQSCVHPLVLENPGNVSLDYKLTLNSVTAWPLRHHKMSQTEHRTSARPRTALHPSTPPTRQKTLSTCTARPRPLTSGAFLDLHPDAAAPCAREQPPQGRTTLNYNPFTIENMSGRIPPKEKVSCKVVFSPMEISEYKAVVSIRVANLHPECSLPEVEVTASSVMPYCHFDVAESDYLESGRRDYTRPGPIGYAPGIPLHPDTKTIEVKVLGVGVTVPIKFHVINPTEEDYSFSWVNISQSQPDVVPSLHCSTVDGRIRAGRQQLMVFSFVSQKVGIAESFWKFSIPKYRVETPFLFVSDVREPAVYFLSGHLNLRPTFIGCSSSESLVLINNEDVPFDFHFLHESLYSEGKLNCLKVDPSAGKVPPHSETSIRVSFTGKSPGKTVFSVKCKVKSLREPFVVMVEAITYAIRPLVAFEDHHKVKHFPDASKENPVDFGSELNPNIPETITFNLTSLSKTSFYYEWDYSKPLLEARHCKMRFSAKTGHVTSFSRGKCDMSIVFSRKSSLVNFPVRLKIRRGPTFRFLVNASASVPPFDFSFSTYDFGYCFLQEKDICYYQTLLTITNKDTSDLFLECALAQSTAFSFCLPRTVVPPKEEMSIPVSFHPRECIPYEDALTLTVNGVYQRVAHLKGHGTEFKVGLAEPMDTSICLGAVKMGKSSTREFALVNKSLAPATVLVGFSDQLPVKGLHLARAKEYPVDLSQDHRLSGVLGIWPSSVFRMKAQGEARVRVTYTPSRRCASFSETISLQWQERAEPLCIVTGCCLGAEISLDKTFLNFGAVVESCRSTLRLKIVNSGSIGARFQWDTSHLSDYDISPTCGYCSPESDVTVSVTFAPSAIENCIKKSVQCLLYLSENETYPSLHLDLLGDCVALPEPSQTLDFQCLVRNSDSKTVQIDNPSGTEWQLLPIISGEYYSGFDALVIPPLSSSLYEINYFPLSMTREKHFHEGSVFFRLPNGRGLLYKLNGVSLPPEPEDVIEREVPCKTKYVELLKVRNWLQCPQRFKVNISSIDNQDDPVCSCTGFEQLEVPALAQKEYSLNFFAYNIGHLRFHVTFVNEETREYIWYDVGFSVVMCGPLEVITLKSGVRQTCHHRLNLENPLKTEILYKLETTSPEIHFDNPLVHVPPMETVSITLSFTPLHSGERMEHLSAACAELGLFPRDLRLIAVEVLPDPPRAFEAPLGASQTQGFVVSNLSPSNALLRCRTDCEDFIVRSEQANVAAGQSLSIEVTYEPSEMGSSKGSLFVESEQAGNFVFLLMGTCGKPLAKGPFVLRAGSGTSVPFKNVFKRTKEFHMYVDNPAFFLKTSEETLLGKEESKICVGLQKMKCLERLPEYKETEMEPRFPVMGQLVVECFNPYVKWQFYLKGVLDK